MICHIFFAPDRQSGGKSGSPNKGEPGYLVVGRLRRPHGVKGEIIMDVLTDFPERLTIGKEILVGKKYSPMTISGLRWHHKAILIKLEGIEDRDEAGLYRNRLVYVPTQDLPELPEGDFYHHEMLGISVVDEEKNPLGELVDIIITGANDVYVVQTQENKEILLPAIESVILEIDVENQEMIVRLPEWA